MTNLSLKGYIAQKSPNTGERVWALYDDREQGIPMFYPTAYMTLELRTNASSSVKKSLQHIKKLYEWGESRGIDIEERLASTKFFEAFEIASLSDYLSRNHSKPQSRAIGREAHAALLQTAGDYLKWLAGSVIKNSNSPTLKSSIETMHDSIIARKPSLPSIAVKNQKIIKKSLKDSHRAALEQLYENPTAGATNPSGIGVKYRLATALKVMNETGCRKSEALALTLGNFQRSSGGLPAMLKFERMHDSPTDHRLNQPVLKTAEREYPISESLAKMIEEYLSDYRAYVPGADFESTAPIFITHIAGPNQGRGLQLSAFDSDLERLKKKNKKLAGLHFHLLRYDWNYRFSEQTDERGLTVKQEEDDRNYLMGWSPTSSMAKIYNLRHTIKSAHKTASLMWLTDRPKKNE